MEARPLRRRWLGPAALLLATALFALTTRAPAPPSGPPSAKEPLTAASGLGGAGPPPWLLPLDDAYIFIRFAQQVSRGRGLRWTDELSSGVTSPAFLAGADGLSGSASPLSGRSG